MGKRQWDINRWSERKEIDKSYTAKSQQMIFIKFLYIFKVLSINQTKYERFDINTRFSN